MNGRCAPSRAASDRSETLTGSDRGYFVSSAPDAQGAICAETFSSGRATQLGEYRLVAQEIIKLETLEITHGTFTITTSSGDVITGTYSGTAATAEEGVIAYETSGPISGGTGRFAEATGSLRFQGLADLTTGDRHETVTVTISLPDRAARSRPPG